MFARRFLNVYRTRIKIITIIVAFVLLLKLYIMPKLREKWMYNVYFNSVCTDCPACHLPSDAELLARYRQRAHDTHLNCTDIQQTLVPRPQSVCTNVRFSLADMQQFYSFDETSKGGQGDEYFRQARMRHLQPDACLDQQHIAIVIPYRNRQQHLVTLLHRFHTMLQEQRIHYTIFVIEQLDDGTPFNRGMVKNIGFHYASGAATSAEARQALGDSKFNCIFFHDVDLVPEDVRNIYACHPTHPRHHSAVLSKNSYRVCSLYDQLIGGVVSFPFKTFLDINGFSNLYFHWGAEDDDMYLRIKTRNYAFTRSFQPVSRYTTIDHSHDAENPHRFRLLANADERIDFDGVNNLVYEEVNVRRSSLFVWVQVKISEQKVVAANSVKHVSRLEDVAPELDDDDAQSIYDRRFKLGPIEWIVSKISFVLFC